MANFRPSLSAPIPNNPFSAPLNPYVIGPWWPEPIGTGLSVDLTTGTLYNSGGGGGGSAVTTTYPLLATTSGAGVDISIAPATITNSGAVQLTSSTTNNSQTLALTAAAGKSLQDQINALILGTTAGIILIGTINGSTGNVASIVNNTYPGFTVGSPLPAAAPANTGTFVLVSTPGTMTPPGGVSTVTAEGDWWYSDGVTWTLIPVGVSGGSALPATASIRGTVFGCTPDTGACAIPVVTLGRSTLPSPYVKGTGALCGGHVFIGCNVTPSYSGCVGEYGTVLVGNCSRSCDNSVVVGNSTWSFTSGGIAIGNSTQISNTGVPNECGAIAIGHKLTVKTTSIALVSRECGTNPLDFCVGRDSVVIGSYVCSFPSQPGGLIAIGRQSSCNIYSPCTLAIGVDALRGTELLDRAGWIYGGGQPLAIGTCALAGLRSNSAFPGAGEANTAVGHYAASGGGTGCFNTFFGTFAGATDSICSVVMGSWAASSRTTDSSVVIGAFSGCGGLDRNNIIIGTCAVPNLTYEGNIFIGTRIGSNTGTLKYNLAIGAGNCYNPPNLNGDYQLALGYSETPGTSCHWLTGCADMNIRPGAGIIDANGSSGTNGQVLSSSGANTVVWSSGNAIPAGALMNFATQNAPAGWLVANGDTVPNGSGTVQGVTADFSQLYVAVGVAYGGPGKLPDMRGMFARGWDSAGGAARNCDPGRALGSQQGFAIENITGSICGISETFGAGGTPSIATAGNALYRSSSAPSRGLTPVSTDSSNSGTMCFNAALSVSTATETRPVNVSVLPCIKY